MMSKNEHMDDTPKKTLQQPKNSKAIMIENVDNGEIDDDAKCHNDEDHETMHEFGVTDPGKIKLA